MIPTWIGWFGLGCIAGAVAGFYVGTSVMRWVYRRAVRRGVFHLPQNCPAAAAEYRRVMRSGAL